MRKVCALVEVENNEKLGFTQGTIKFPDEYTVAQRVHMLFTFLHGAKEIAGGLVVEDFGEAVDVIDHDYVYTVDVLQAVNDNIYKAVISQRDHMQCSCDPDYKEPGQSYIQIGNGPRKEHS